MSKRQLLNYILISAIIVVLATISEKTSGELIDGYLLERNGIGGSDRQVELLVTGDGLDQEYPYEVVVESIPITEADAKGFFDSARKEIDESVFGGENADCVTGNLTIKDTYANGMVDAEWQFDNYNVIDYEGNLLSDSIPAEGTVINTQVELTCGEYQEEYNFAFNVQKPQLNHDETILSEIKKEILEAQKSTESTLKLPEKVLGNNLTWREEKQHLVAKIILLEIVIFVLLIFANREKSRQKEKQVQLQMKLDYSELVSKMAILLGSGMTIRQAWNRISARYIDEKQKDDKKVRYAYEHMLTAYYQMQDGESEPNAYHQFGENCGLNEYHRFARMLVQNLQKGSRGLCQMLDREATTAFDERKVIAKKIGEEAGTKLLAPLMIMLIVVMAIIMFPAVLEFMQ